MTHLGPLDLSLQDLKDFVALETTPPATKSGTDGAANLDQKWRVFEKRFAYAWNFFDFHAKQRTTMFNFFLIFVGFILSAYAGLLKDGSFPVSVVLALVGAGLTIVFVFLDRRNEELVHVAEAVLSSLESDVLFKGYHREIKWPMRRKWLGKMIAEPRTAQLGLLLRQATDDQSIGRSKYEHGKWIPRFQYAIVLLFAGLAIFSWCHRNAVQKPAQTDVRIVQ